MTVVLYFGSNECYLSEHKRLL